MDNTVKIETLVRCIQYAIELESYNTAYDMAKLLDKLVEEQNER